MTTLIQSIKKTCQALFTESQFSFKQVDISRFAITGDNLSISLDNYGTGKREIKALKWFDEFWVYMEINIVPSKLYPNIFLTVSIFQGSADDNIKTQLFRAEWDNYEINSESENSVHPQPHWHIYPFKYDSKTYEDFEVYNSMKVEEENAEGFESQILKIKNKIIDIRYMHFAMNAQWAEDKSCIHRISDDKVLTRWLSGLLTHIRQQLEYVK